MITRFTVPAFAHDLIALRVPFTAASTKSFCRHQRRKKKKKGNQD
jgi:hypothetical protein